LIVRPRHEQFGFNEVMKMYFYVEFDSLPSDDSADYGLGPSNFLLNIAEDFLAELERIRRRGLIGRYNKVSKEENFVKGEIDFKNSKMTRNQVLNLQTEYDEHTVDNKPNRVIKYCITCLQEIINDKNLLSELNKHKKSFRQVSDVTNPNSSELKDTFLSSHEKHYQEILKLCEIIIENLYYSEIGKDRKGVSFLVNYDTLFEDFIRSVLMRDYGEDFEYWGETGEKTYAEYYDTLEEHRKSKDYLPDLLYKYNREEKTTQTVLDVKNKVDKIFSNPDIYQMKFYSDMLDTDQAVLIYPSTEDVKSSKIKLETKKGNLEVQAIFFNLKGRNKEFLDNMQEFAKEVYKAL
jgi:5-methylcytosine-specific restriction endonuclease McrBC regulatory subunit McrC